MEERLVWLVLASRNVEATMRYYRETAGWRFEPLSIGQCPWWIAKTSVGEAVCVFADSSQSDFPDAQELWIPHFTVDDVDNRVKDAERFGATILRPPFDVAELGRVALLRQPGGGIVAWRSPLSS